MGAWQSQRHWPTRAEEAPHLVRLIQRHTGVRRPAAPGQKQCWAAEGPWAVTGLGSVSPERHSADLARAWIVGLSLPQTLAWGPRSPELVPSDLMAGGGKKALEQPTAGLLVLLRSAELGA
ncbi:hypothetical protein NDU88_006118 [Pleurodeles waltl]|uniref:Uncharacterized protein n=1 Tax=Pleurodeles waltl TaxID=8319 RepID=A0AAV7RL13_PLEWA|nr:hypothetical protein NDU88_006118 [Pleurodeles waltl]